MDRVTTARLRADASQFKREIASAAAAAKALDAALGGGNLGGLDIGFNKAATSASNLDSEIDNLNDNTLIIAKHWNADLADMNKSLEEAGAHLHTFNNEVEETNRVTARSGDSFRGLRQELGLFTFDAGETQNRMKILTQAILAIGPAAVPVLAAAGAGLAAIAGQMTFAVAGATTAALAFAGVGDALKALNEAAIDPSIANLEKLQEAMDQLGPAGQNFVVFLQDARSELHRLQDLAAEGFLPGLQDGMESLLEQMPHLEGVISSVSFALGDLASQGGKAFANEEWQDFFTYLATDANQILTNMGVALGNFIQGIASMITAFGPLTASFSGGLQNMAESFAGWAATLEQNQGFQEFIGYVRQVTPQILDALRSAAEAIIALGVATRNISGVALQGLEALLDVLTMFLESPLAAPLLALASAMGAVSTASTALALIGGSKLLTFIKLMPTAVGLAGLSMLDFARNTNTAKMSMAGFRGPALQAAGAIGLVTLAFADFDEQLGVSNTLNFAAAGALTGNPMVAAAGATVGALFDLTSAWKGWNDAVKAADETLANDAGNMNARIDEIARLKEESNGLQETLWRLGGLTGLGVFDLFFDNTQENEIADKTEALESFQNAIQEVANVMGKGTLVSTGDFIAVAEEIQPVLDQMDSSIEELEAAYATGGVTWQTFMSTLAATRAEMDSLAGRSKAVAEAVGTLDSAFLDAGASADVLSTALESLTTPFLDLVASRDAFTTGLRDLDEQLNKNNKTLRGNSDAAIQNRGALIGVIDLYKGMIDGLAKSGAGSEELARELDAGREAIIRFGKEAGLSGEQIRWFLGQVGLTPKLIKITLEAQGIDEAEDDARNLADAYNKLPKEVRVQIRDEGFPETDAGLRRLARRMELTPKQVRIIADVRDNATGKLNGIKIKAKDVDRTKATPKVGLDTGEFEAKSAKALFAVRRLDLQKADPSLDVDDTKATAKMKYAEDSLERWSKAEGTATLSADDKASAVVSDAMFDLIRFDNYTATATIAVNRTGNDTAAEGGLILGPGGPTDDTAGIYALSNREYVARAASVEHYGPDLFHALNAKRASREAIRKAAGMAQGGLVGMAGGGRPRDRGDRLSASDVFSKTLRDPTLMLKDIARALHDMRDEARDVVVAERELRQERAEAKELARRVREAEKGEGGVPKHLRDQQKQQAKELEAAEKALAKQREELSKATQKLKNQEQALLAQAQAVSDAITAQGEIFGGSGTSVTAAGILSKLRHATQDARQFKEDIAVLRARGLDESLISQLYEQGSTPEGVRAVHSLATASKSMLNRINRQQGRLERIGAAAGAQSVQKGGDIVVNINGPIHTTDVHQLAKELPKHLRKALRIAMAK